MKRQQDLEKRLCVAEQSYLLVWEWPFFTGGFFFTPLQKQNKTSFSSFFADFKICLQSVQMLSLYCLIKRLCSIYSCLWFGLGSGVPVFVFLHVSFQGTFGFCYLLCTFSIYLLSEILSETTHRGASFIPVSPSHELRAGSQLRSSARWDYNPKSLFHQIFICLQRRLKPFKSNNQFRKVIQWMCKQSQEKV